VAELHSASAYKTRNEIKMAKNEYEGKCANLNMMVYRSIHQVRGNLGMVMI